MTTWRSVTSAWEPGAPMAKQLVEWPGGLIVFDVRTEAMTPLAELGATLADSIADVAKADVSK